MGRGRKPKVNVKPWCVLGVGGHASPTLGAVLASIAGILVDGLGGRLGEMLPRIWAQIALQG